MAQARGVLAVRLRAHRGLCAMIIPPPICASINRFHIPAQSWSTPWYVTMEFVRSERWRRNALPRSWTRTGKKAPWTRSSTPSLQRMPRCCWGLPFSRHARDEKSGRRCDFLRVQSIGVRVIEFGRRQLHQSGRFVDRAIEPDVEVAASIGTTVRLSCCSGGRSWSGLWNRLNSGCPSQFCVSME